jgi:hypothetical protein
MVFPSCVGYCTLQCTENSRTCDGRRVKGQVYNFQGDTKCFKFIGPDENCHCPANGFVALPDTDNEILWLEQPCPAAFEDLPNEND